MAPLLAACGLHSGAGVLAFLRGGALWTIQSDGSSLMQIASGGVAGFAWSPDHHQFVVRYGATNYLQPPQSTLGAPDAPSNLGIVSVNGGAALQITPNDSGVLRSDAWWNTSGNRLLYRERLEGSGQAPTYIVSQGDQPAGIARKLVFDAATLPALSPDGQRVAAIDAAGNVRVGAPNTLGAVLATGALTTLPTSLRPARVLWQPHANALLYDTSAPSGGVALILRDLTGGSHTIATVSTLLDAAFSPEGSLLLVRTPSQFQVYNLQKPDIPVLTWPESDPLALPWWSPDSRSLLVQDIAGWRLVNVPTETVQTVLVYGQPGADAYLPTNVDWHPAATSPFSPDGSQVVFAAPHRSVWLGAPLPAPTSGSIGLYVVSYRSGAPAQPVLVDSGADYAPGWSYLDPATAFLVAS